MHVALTIALALAAAGGSRADAPAGAAPVDRLRLEAPAVAPAVPQPDPPAAEPQLSLTLEGDALQLEPAHPAAEPRLSLGLDGDATSTSGQEPEALRIARLRRWERALKWSTAGALVVTTTLGTFAAINQPTAFGDGRCQTGGPVLGTYGCDRGLSTLHGASAVLSATLYTADGALALSLPGPQGNVKPAARPWHRALTFVHLGGFVAQPILGLVSAFPQVIGVRGRAPSDPFPRNVRTTHVILGYVTTAAFLATLALEL